MTKNLGTDYSPHEKRRKPNRVLSWMFDLLFPLVLVVAAVAFGKYVWPL